MWLEQDVWLEQADAALLTENEEVTLMDWGNAVIRVLPAHAAKGSVWEVIRGTVGCIAVQLCIRRMHRQPS